MLWSLIVSLFSLAILPSWVVLRVRVLLKNEHSGTWSDNEEHQAFTAQSATAGAFLDTTPRETSRMPLPHSREMWTAKWGEQHALLNPPDAYQQVSIDVNDKGGLDVHGKPCMTNELSVLRGQSGRIHAVQAGAQHTKHARVKRDPMAGLRKMAALVLALLVPGLASQAALHCFVWGCPSVEHRSEPTPTRRALGACFFFVFMDHVLVSAIIPDSLALATSIHASYTFSGLLIGAYVGSTAVGYVFVWLLNSQRPDVSVVHMRPLLLWSVVAIGAGMTIFAGSLVLLESNLLLDDFAAVMLIIGRSLVGVGTGCQLFTTRIFAMRVTPQAEQPACNALYTFYMMLGIGMGPVVASFIQTVLSLVGSSAEVRLVSVTGMNLAVCAAMVSACWGFPDHEDIDLIPEAEPVSLNQCAALQGQTRQLSDKHKLVICCIIFVAGVRGTAVAGLEVATSMVLESDLRWSSGVISWVVGFSYLACIPQRKLYEKLKCTMSTVYWIRLLMATSVVGSVLLVESLADGLLPGPEGRTFLLVIADVLLIPSLMLVGALLEGIAFSLALPSPSVWSLNHLVLYTRLVVNCLGSLVGPALSRWLLNLSGQDGYALQQLLLTLTIFFVVEIGILGSELEGISTINIFVNKGKSIRPDGSLCL